MTLADAAIVLIVIDATAVAAKSDGGIQLHEEDRRLIDAVSGRSALIALNKCDLVAEGLDHVGLVAVSANAHPTVGWKRRR